ncbi:MAG: hypothetical protein ACOH1Y_14335 [Propionicimonas sp.]
MTITINPGAGPVTSATIGNARANMEQFLADIVAQGGAAQVASYMLHDDGDTAGGGFTYLVIADGIEYEVEMPGLPLALVKYGAGPGQRQFNFPRLHVDGNSWLWPSAVNACGPDA